MTGSQNPSSAALNTKTSSRPSTFQGGNNLNQSNNNNNYSNNQTATSSSNTTNGNNNLASNVIGCSSATFQQIKQTQASLARLSRHIHQHQGQVVNHHSSQQNNSNNYNNNNNNHGNQVTRQHQHQQQTSGESNQIASVGQNKSTTFVDCLIRRFKDCFSEDFCTVPMFVVGNLSPGSDGTHLILPPCVSLGGQNISRFSSPKNLRLMNSIRESCRSIEELDLGRNKLTDLIEIYKILQCTPNLKFLNLSENDLSRTAPVAMAAANCPTSGTMNGTFGFNSIWSPANSGSLSSLGSNVANFNHHQATRTCLGPLNQNLLAQSSTSSPVAVGPRRVNSTLTSSTLASANSSRYQTRLQERARRQTATAALAQSKKTPSSIASKLTGSAHVTINGSRCHTGRGLAGAGSGSQAIRSASTMHLARSLSSLSAKNVRSLPGAGRKGSDLRDTSIRCRQQTRTPANKDEHSSDLSKKLPNQSDPVDRSGKPKSNSFVETISESEQDVDMKESSNSNIVNQNTSITGRITTTAPSSISNTITTTTVANNTVSANINTITKQQQQQQQQQVTSSHTTRQPTTGINHNKPTSLCTLSTQNLHQHQHQQQPLPFRRFTFESIRALALNNTGCQWRVVCSIVSRMPNLEELHLSLNNYERIDLDLNQEFRHYSLKRLYLCNNPKLTDWQELSKLLIAFPSLEALSIADCNISQIPENLSQAREWRKLCGLNINGWPIKEWPVIERLNQLPSLIDLKCRNLELLNTIDAPREHLIARLPRLQRLNGSEIEERDQAEKAFLRFFVTNSHLERPNRFHELMQIHGAVDAQVDVDVDLSPPSQANVRIVYLNRNFYRETSQDDILMSEDFLIKLMDNIDTEVVQKQTTGKQSDQTETNLEENMNITREYDDQKSIRLFKDDCQEVVSIEVDLRQSVRKFKFILADLFGLDSQNIILYYIDREMVGLMGPEIMKHNQKKLWNYNVQDGDQFIVEER